MVSTLETQEFFRFSNRSLSVKSLSRQM